MTVHRQGIRRIVLIAIALAAGMTPAAHARPAPTRLWYRLHVSYTAHLHTERQWYGGTRMPDYEVTTGVFEDEGVHWTAVTEGAVLVRIGPRGNWSVYHGELLGTIHLGQITDRTNSEAAAQNVDTSTLVIADCYVQTDGSAQPDPPGVFPDFRDGDLLISTALGPAWFPIGNMQRASWVGERTHTTGDQDQCNQICCGGEWVAPNDETTSYPLLMPIVPNFDETAIEQLRAKRPLFPQRGPNRFGAKHVVLTSSGSFKDGPHIAPTNPNAFPDTFSEDSSGDEHWTLVLDRCPGTRPC